MAITETSGSGSRLCAATSGLQTRVASQAGPASYATGGFATDPETDLSLSAAPLAVLVQADDEDYQATWDSAAKKTIVAQLSTGAEVANTTDISGITFTYVVYAKP